MKLKELVRENEIRRLRQKINRTDDDKKEIKKLESELVEIRKGGRNVR